MIDREPLAVQGEGGVDRDRRVRPGFRGRLLGWWRFRQLVAVTCIGRGGGLGAPPSCEPVAYACPTAGTPRAVRMTLRPHAARLSK